MDRQQLTHRVRSAIRRADGHDTHTETIQDELMRDIDQYVADDAAERERQRRIASASDGEKIVIHTGP